MLIANPKSHYHFLKGIEPYSCGVISDPLHEIVHVTLGQILPWREGFDRIEAHLQAIGRDRHALCGIELRCPTPYSMQGFIEFNQTYCEVLKAWDLYIGDINPIARTNVSPLHQPPEAPSLHGFSYIVPADSSEPTLVIAGAGELREGVLVSEGIIRRGETDPAAMCEKADYVMKIMEERLLGLGGRWNLINTVDIYTIYPIDVLVEKSVLMRMGPARRHGVRWYHTRPPVIDIDFEMDMRGVRTELII
jgi:hypothetical protein